MNVKQKFTIEDIIRWFEKARVSDIYSRLYCVTHMIGAETGYDYFLGNVAVGIEEKVKVLLKEESNSAENFNFRLVGGPQYELSVKHIQDKLGIIAEPYIQEHRLLGEIRRRMDFVLIYANGALEKCPDDIKNKFHQDNATVLALDLERLISWLREHPEHDILPRDNEFQETYKEVVKRLAADIHGLINFYAHSRENQIDHPESRKALVKYMNRLFDPKSRFSYRDVDIG